MDRRGKWDGLTTGEVADLMGCSERTAYRYLSEMAEKLGGDYYVRKNPHIGNLIFRYLLQKHMDKVDANLKSILNDHSLSRKLDRMSGGADDN